MKVITYLKHFLNNPNDPIKHCEVYKETGCSHVDGMLCELATCTIRAERNAKARLVEIEVAAQAVYRLFDGAELHPWLPCGNSNKQDDARRYARAAIESLQK